LEFEVWDIEEGEFPTTLDGIDGFIITGSKSSVYDDKPWIRSLEALVRELYGATLDSGEPVRNPPHAPTMRAHEGVERRPERVRGALPATAVLDHNLVARGTGHP
jgi:hypothetical protein